MTEFLIWIEELAISVWLRESLWGFPIIQTLHAVGMAFLVGVVTVINLRIIGIFRRIPVTMLVQLLFVIWLGFAVNGTTGLIMYMADASLLTYNTIFQIKVGLIFAGFIIALVLRRMVYNNMDNWSQSGEIPINAKLLSVSSLLIWYGAVLAGRLTAYF